MKKIIITITLLCTIYLPVFAQNTKESNINNYINLCNAGDFSLCAELGNEFLFGKKIEQSKTKAVKFYINACDGGNDIGCHNLGIQLYKGEGVGRSVSRAKDAFKKACDLGFQEGCKNYRVLRNQ